MILRIEPSRSAGKHATPAGTTAPHARDPNLARTNLEAIEMAVVLIVAALVMVSIILSTGCSSRLPEDSSAAHTSQPQRSRTTLVASQWVGVPAQSLGRPGNPVEATPGGPTSSSERLEDAKRNARESEVSDLSVGL